MWPLSRKNLPKQLLSFHNNDSLLQLTVKRLIKKVKPKNIFTLTSENYKQATTDQLLEIDSDLVENIFFEPEMKNTLPAISWATAMIHKRDPNALVSVFPSDNIFKDEGDFHAVWDASLFSAEKKFITLIGIKPTKAETGYGYIQVGETFDELQGVSLCRALSFKEKPDFETAQTYLDDGQYLWNGGIFIFKAFVFLNELKKNQKEVFELSMALAKSGYQKADPLLYAKYPNISIDHGLMEKVEDLAVIPAHVEWADLGNWQSLYEYLEKDNCENVAHGDVILLKSQGNLLWSQNGTLAVYGMNDVIAIQTGDVTLICPRNKASEIKNLVEKVGELKPELLNSQLVNQK